MPGGGDEAQLQQIQQGLNAMSTITPTTPPWLKNMQPATLPQGAPGQLQGLARDMAAGGFGNAKANMGWLDQVYSPVRTMRPGAAPKPAATSPARTSPSDANNASDKNKRPEYATGSYTWGSDGKLVKVTSPRPTGRNFR